MSNNLVTTEANRLLDASLGTAAYVSPTGPIKLALNTSTGTPTAAGTEVAGGSYARQTITFAAAAGQTATNNTSITFTSLPAATVIGLEIYDSAGTPRRSWVGALTASKTVSAGDSLSFASSSISVNLGS